MAKLNDVQDLLTRIDQATAFVAKKLKDAADKIESGGLTAAEESAVVDSLRSAADRLEVLGADPTDPVPAEQPPAEQPPSTEPPA